MRMVNIDNLLDQMEDGASITKEEIDDWAFCSTEKAVAVVRCNECKHLDTAWSEDGYYWCRLHGWKWGGHYCADGERRTE